MYVGSQNVVINGSYFENTFNKNCDVKRRDSNEAGVTFLLQTLK